VRLRWGSNEAETVRHDAGVILARSPTTSGTNHSRTLQDPSAEVESQMLRQFNAGDG
jgi:hypothetical protein